MIRVMIADDHSIVREGLKKILALTQDINVTAEVANGAEIIKRLRGAADVDLLLLDFVMPGVSGVDLIARIKLNWGGLPILVFTMHNETQVAIRALKAGASGYITKDSDPERLLAAIRKVSAGEKYLDPEVVEQIAQDFESSNLPLPQTSLADRETAVFRLLLEGKLPHD